MDEEKDLNKESEEEKSFPQKIDEIYDAIKPKIDKGKKSKKPKVFKVPAKGRVSKSKAAKGFMIVEKIDENNNVSFEKQKIDQEVYQTKDKIYHASDGREIFYYKGRPLLHQPAWRQNPIGKEEIGNTLERINNVYGQKPILARMQTAVYTGEIKKKSMGGLVWILAIIVGGYLLAHYVLKIV